MQTRQKLHQSIDSPSQITKDTQEKVKNKTLPQTINEPSNQLHKVTKQNNLNLNLTERISFKLKFNTSYDNLRCFISEKKPQRYRSVSTRLSKQSKSQVCLSNIKSILLSEKEDPILEACKSETEKNYTFKIKQLQADDQSDLSRILSNEIIHSIERKGIDYDWNDIEQIKSEEFLSENKDEENELQQIFDAFSDHKKIKRLSFQSRSQLNRSLIYEERKQSEIDYRAEQTQPCQYFDANSGYIVFDNSYDKNYSFASTMQPYSNLYYPMTAYPIENEILLGQHPSGLRSMPSSMFQSYEFIIQPQGLGRDPRTTLMIKNIPNKYTIHFLSQQIDPGFGNSYDFLYLPCDTKSGANQGYGFINFIDLDALKSFYEKFHGKKWKRFKSQKICNLTYARLQGINSLIEHFQNSKVLNHKEKKYQPIIKSLSEIHHLIKKQQTNQQGQK